MSLIATFVLAASTTASGAVLPQCSWDKPGANPFMGDVVAAVDRYQDIPAETRAKLKARMKTRNYDDIAVIERDAIKGRAEYAPEIRDMHFGAGSICRTVTRSKWTAKTQERGLVYCEDGQCILVPTVCRNVSRVKRLAAPRAIAPAQAANVASATREEAPLEFEAPAAGPTAVAAPGSFAQVASTPPSLDPAPSPTGSTPPRTFAGSSGGQPLPEPGVPPLPPGKPTIASKPDLPGDTIPAVPEPSTWAMLAIGLLTVAYRARRKA